MFAPDLLKNKRILITGGGTGIGKSMAKRFMELGAVPIICSRREKVLEQTAGELSAETGGRIEWRQLDIRDPEAVEQVVDSVWEGGPVDALINNAAGNFLARTETLSHRAMESYHRIWCLNI